MITRHVETLFCDDIRHEIHGKVSFIGVYSSKMFVASFPVMLPKLCLSIKIVTPADKPLQRLNLRVLRDDDLLQEIAVDEEQLAGASDLAEEIAEALRKQQIQMTQFMLVFSPIQFEAACTLHVRVQTEEGELHGVALSIEQAPSAASLSGG